jgi:hypothetical protein
MLDNEIHVLSAGDVDWKTPAFQIPVEEVEETPHAA